MTKPSLKYITTLLLLWNQVEGDVYLHNPRGSNNRLDENTRDRKNGKRLFDSQNNNRGGYNVGSLYYYIGSILNIEWTSQHSCGQKNSHCETVLQYMCHDSLRDGVTTSTIPLKTNQCNNNNCDTDVTYGMHESYEYYMNCKYRFRNKGLFTAGRVRNNGATRTRQNPGGTRYGYECPEERDYYPYWHPTPWRDIAVLTNHVSKCEMYQRESQNVKSRYSCVPPSNYIQDMEKRRITIKLLPNNKEDCEKLRHPPGSNNTFKWVETNAFGIPPPLCSLSLKNRDNHLGNTLEGFPNMFNWTIPETPHDHCVLRLRYNISTNDYNPWSTNATTKVDIGRFVGVDDNEEAKDRGYKFEDNPTVEPLKKSVNGIDLGEKLKLQLAVDTSQYGRTFQDRSHSFGIRSRPKELEKSKIHNLNVRGMRGNIVQVYPSVEYDFVPNRLMSSVGDMIHFQWTGSNTNNRNNDGQGLAGTDRSNIVLLSKQNNNTNEATYGYWGNNYPTHLQNVTFLGFSRRDFEKLAILRPEQFGGELSELDDAGTYFDLGPKTITQAGVYHYMSTRNNNFSNRSQKGKIVVTKIKFSEASIGWSGGKVVLDEGEQGVWFGKGAITRSRLIHVEEWSETEGSARIEKKGGYLKDGDDITSNFLVIYPFEEIAEGNKFTIKMTVTTEDVAIYHSVDFIHWRKIPDMEVKELVAVFQGTRGGMYVARQNGGSQTKIIVIVFVLLVLGGIVTGTILYFRRRSGPGSTPRTVFADIGQRLKAKT